MGTPKQTTPNQADKQFKQFKRDFGEMHANCNAAMSDAIFVDDQTEQLIAEGQSLIDQIKKSQAPH